MVEGCFSEIDMSVYLPVCQNTRNACCQPPAGCSEACRTQAWAVGRGPLQIPLSQKAECCLSPAQPVSDLSKWINCVSISTSVFLPGLFILQIDSYFLFMAS